MLLAPQVDGFALVNDPEPAWGVLHTRATRVYPFDSGGTVAWGCEELPKCGSAPLEAGLREFSGGGLKAFDQAERRAFWHQVVGSIGVVNDVGG